MKSSTFFITLERRLENVFRSTSCVLFENQEVEKESWVSDGYQTEQISSEDSVMKMQSRKKMDSLCRCHQIKERA